MHAPFLSFPLLSSVSFWTAAISHLHVSFAAHSHSLFLFQSLCVSSSKSFFSVCCGKGNKAGGKWGMHVNRDHISGSEFCAGLREEEKKNKTNGEITWLMKVQLELLRKQSLNHLLIIWLSSGSAHSEALTHEHAQNTSTNTCLHVQMYSTHSKKSCSSFPLFTYLLLIIQKHLFLYWNHLPELEFTSLHNTSTKK